MTLSTPKSKNRLKLKMKIIDYLVIPLILSIIISISTPFINNMALRFVFIFLLSMMSYTIMYAVKKNMKLKTGNHRRKIWHIFLKTLIFSGGIYIFMLGFLFGEVPPTFTYVREDNTLIVDLTQLWIYIGMWVLVWLLAYLISKAKF